MLIIYGNNELDHGISYDNMIKYLLWIGYSARKVLKILMDRS